MIAARPELEAYAHLLFMRAASGPFDERAPRAGVRLRIASELGDAELAKQIRRPSPEEGEAAPSQADGAEERGPVHNSA